MFIEKIIVCLNPSIQALDKKEKKLAKENEERRRQEGRDKAAELDKQNFMKEFLKATE